MPKGWNDDNAAEHGFKITWDDFTGQDPMIAQSWPGLFSCRARACLLRGDNPNPLTG
jgi:hypothetical protein